MVWKLLTAIVIAYLGWRLWKDMLGLAPKRTAPRMAGDDAAAASARALLGVPPGADSATIRAAHRRLMAAAHPDVGGSAEHARALNAARDLLIGRALGR